MFDYKQRESKQYRKNFDIIFRKDELMEREVQRLEMTGIDTSDALEHVKELYASLGNKYLKLLDERFENK